MREREGERESILKIIQDLLQTSWLFQHVPNHRNSEAFLGIYRTYEVCVVTGAYV